MGIEREWSGHAAGPGARFAGARTFLFLGLLGGLAGLIAQAGYPLAGATLLLAGAALAIAAYLSAARRPGEDAIDGTTEAAALAVLGLGFVAGTGELRLPAATGAVIVLALREKSTIQRFVHRLGEVELRAAFQFAVLALVLLPILPEGPYGPLGGIRPRELWLVVLLVSGLNFAGYLARRAIGETHGTAVAGILGGLISSTAVALSFSRQSQDRDREGAPLALGVLGACTMLLPRLLVLSVTLRPALVPELLPFFLPPLMVGAGLLAAGFLRARGTPDKAIAAASRSPLRLGSAILLALGFQAVLMAMVWVQGSLGTIGVLASSALLGLTDMDALTLSMTRLAADPSHLRTAATAMAIGVLANTCLKLSVVLVLGRGGFRWRAGLTLLALLLASAAGLWLGAA